MLRVPAIATSGDRLRRGRSGDVRRRQHQRRQRTRVPSARCPASPDAPPSQAMKAPPASAPRCRAGAEPLPRHTRQALQPGDTGNDPQHLRRDKGVAPKRRPRSLGERGRSGTPRGDPERPRRLGSTCVAPRRVSVSGNRSIRPLLKRISRKARTTKPVSGWSMGKPPRQGLRPRSRRCGRPCSCRPPSPRS